MIAALAALAALEALEALEALVVFVEVWRSAWETEESLPSLGRKECVSCH